MQKQHRYTILGAIILASFSLNQAGAAPTAPCTTTVLNEGPSGPTLSAQWIYCEGAGSELCIGSVNGNNTWGLGCTVGHQPFTQTDTPDNCTPVSALSLQNCPSASKKLR